MKKDIFSIGSKKKANIFDQMLHGFDGDKAYPCDNPVYEDPRDVVGGKPVKPPRMKPSTAPVMTSPRAMSLSKEARALLKEQKRKLTKKYESLIVSIMDKCEENVLLIAEKEAVISKLKDKLKSVLEYNKLFADENDQLKEQHSTMVKYIEECKINIQELQTKGLELRERNKELEDRMRKFEVPDRDCSELSTAIPLVEVCMSCSSRQIILQQVKDHNTRMHKDMQALKDVLYRLNVQLAKYRERVRDNIQSLSVDGREPLKPHSDTLDSLITSSIGYKQEPGNIEDVSNKTARDTPTRVADLSGLLSAQALTPLFDAYQDNIQEKENLIMDYEKQFENLNRKSKQLVTENKSLQEKVSSLEDELVHLSKSQRKLVLERETVELEKKTLAERAEKVELKLKEVYELYEDKMAAMMRDYETVHREYFAAKSALAASEGKMERVHAELRVRTVPADLHERRVDHCKRLLDELKHQYGMESERSKEQLQKLQEQKNLLEEKYACLCKEHESAKEELKTALKNVRLYRKAAGIFRARLRSNAAALASLRRSTRRRARSPNESAVKVDAIRQEIKAVKTRAYSTLEELERRIMQQERRAARAQLHYRRELDRAEAALQHKEAIISSLIDKVADVEEVRLSQSATHQRLQGIVSESSPERSPSPQKEKGRDEKRREERKLTPAHGGYYQETRDKRRIQS